MFNAPKGEETEDFLIGLLVIVGKGYHHSVDVLSSPRIDELNASTPVNERISCRVQVWRRSL
jgi:hypothetical protein